MPKTKDQTLRVRVVPASDTAPRDEVFVESKADDKGNYPEPYINRAIYAKPGLFKDGEMGADAVAQLEEKSTKLLEKEHAEKLAEEAKEREALTKAIVKEEG